MARYIRRVPNGVNEMKDDAFLLSCSVKNNLFKDTNRGVNVDCLIRDGVGHRIGDVSFSVASGGVNGGNKMNIRVSKDLVGNLIADSFNLSNVIEKFFS